MKIQVNSQGKAYLTSGSKLLLSPSSGAAEITATNLTGSAITSGSKVWINKVGGAYNIVDFYGYDTNFSIYGAPTLNNKVASGFSTDDCLLVTRVYQYSTTNNIHSMEAVFKFHTPTSENWTTNGRIINGRNHYDDFSLDINQTEPAFSFLNADYVNKRVQVAPANLASDTDYWVKVVYDGTNLIGLYSVDGENYITQDSIPRSPSELYLASSQYSIGNRYESGGGSNPICVWNGSIDLNESYIKINGAYWWLPYGRDVTPRSITGVAKQNISSGSSGTVATFLEVI